MNPVFAPSQYFGLPKLDKSQIKLKFPGLMSRLAVSQNSV